MRIDSSPWTSPAVEWDAKWNGERHLEFAAPPVARGIVDLVADLPPAARRFDRADELSAIPRLIQRGAYPRQRAVAAAHDGDLVCVADSLLSEMRDGLDL